MRNIVKIKLLLAALLFGIFFSLSPAMAADLTYCGNCHNWTAKPNSEVTKFILPVIPDGSASGSTVDKSKCKACHNGDILAPKHQGVALSVQTVNGVIYGAFISRDSLYQLPSNLHAKHNAVAMYKITGPTCARCHDVASCTSCHSSVPHKDHYAANPVNPLTKSTIVTPVLNVSTGYVQNIFGTIYPTWQLPMSCAAAECHQTLPAPKLKRNDGKDLCFNCHSTGLAGHDAPAIHATGYVLNPAIDCSQCHKKDLASEHAARNDEASGQPYDCLTCHKSSRPDVAAAIKNKVNTCDGCHVSFDHVSVHSSNLDVNCQQCHKNNLVNEHLSNNVTQTKNLGCETCHQNNDSRIKNAISSNNTQCTACHTQGHNINFISRVPADIPLYPGYEWSTPQPASIWASEEWMDQTYTDSGQLVISNRRTDITGQQVFEFYKNQLTSSGWTPAPEQPASGSDFFSVEYTKNLRKLKIMYYGGENHTPGPVVSTGYRIELLYK